MCYILLKAWSSAPWWVPFSRTSTIVGTILEFPPTSHFYLPKAHKREIFVNIVSTKSSITTNLFFVWTTLSWEPKVLLLETISSCCHVMTQDLYMSLLVSSTNFMADILGIYPNFLLIVIGTTQALVPSKNIKWFSWRTRIASVGLRKSYPKMFEWTSNGTIAKSKFPNHSPTLNGVQQTTLTIRFIDYFMTLNMALLFSSLWWSVVTIHSLTNLWVMLVSIKAITFNPLIVMFTKQRSCLPTSYNSCSWPPITNLHIPIVKAPKTSNSTFEVYYTWSIIVCDHQTKVSTHILACSNMAKWMLVFSMLSKNSWNISWTS